jgi:hypothetical protein
VLLLVTTLVVVILSVLLIVRLFSSDDGDDAGLALLQGLAQVPLSLLDLLASGIRAPARQGSASVTPQQLWSLLWDLPGEGADTASLGFLSAVFSILFGDGDPKARLEPLRWRRIAAFLRLRGGVVIAEDLPPLLDLPDCPSDPDRRRDLADAAMLPVPPLRERAFRFSRAGAGQRVGYGVAVGALLVLSPWLLAITPAWLPPVAWLARFAIGYALLLLLLPLARLPLQHWRNRAIAARNRRRQAWARAARNADPQLKRRRAAARRLGATEAGRPAPRVVYDSGRDLLEQTIDGPGRGPRPTA